jgi:hypothetical protein
MSTPSDAPPKLDLNIVQLLAGTLAAVTAAVVASRLGVAGTVIGTAVGSIVATVGGALYTVSIRRTHARLRRLRPHDPTSAQLSTDAGGSPGAGRPSGGDSVWRRLHLPGNWPVLAGSAVAVFVLSMGTVWAVEALGGRSLCALTGGCDSRQTSTFAQPPPTTPPPAAASPTPFERATPSPSDTSAPAPVVSAQPTSRPAPSATAPQASGSPAAPGG